MLCNCRPFTVCSRKDHDFITILFRNLHRELSQDGMPGCRYLGNRQKPLIGFITLFWSVVDCSLDIVL